MRADYYRWRAAMANPKEYGDRKQVEVSGGIEHLHLDALRSISAKARIANDLGHAMLPHVSSVNISDGQPIDTDQLLDTE